MRTKMYYYLMKFKKAGIVSIFLMGCIFVIVGILMGLRRYIISTRKPPPLFQQMEVGDKLEDDFKNNINSLYGPDSELPSLRSTLPSDGRPSFFLFVEDKNEFKKLIPSFTELLRKQKVSSIVLTVHVRKQVIDGELFDWGKRQSVLGAYALDREGNIKDVNHIKLAKEQIDFVEKHKKE